MLTKQLKTLARHAAIYGSADVFSQVINLALVPILTLYLSTPDYGVLGILLLFGVMIKILFRMGLDSGFFRIYYDVITLFARPIVQHESEVESEAVTA